MLIKEYKFQSGGASSRLYTMLTIVNNTTKGDFKCSQLPNDLCEAMYC
jgi:hypothetical protein